MPLPRLLTAELPDISERWRPWVLPLLALFAMGYALTVTVDAMFHHSIMLGPGFVDEGRSSYQLAADTFAALQQRYPQQALLLTWIFLPLLALVMLQNAVVIVRGYTRFEQATGHPYSLKELVLMFALNGLLVGLLLLIITCIGLVYQLAGGEFVDGWSILRRVTQWCSNLVDQTPTLLNLPRPLPLIVTVLLVDLVYYWFHRISHGYRVPWLLLHRPHHMTEHLILPVTQPVFAAAPLFLLVAIPLQILTGIATKLFNPEPMIVEALILRAFTHSLGIYSHCEAYYRQMQDNRFLRKLSAFFGIANYHFVHHSSRPEHSLINLSGGFCWLLWDRVFGTFVEPPHEPPRTGLTNNPPLYQNPLRLALSGMLQIGYELRHNSPRLWWKILFADSWYVPAVSHDFAVKNSPKTPTKENF